MLTRPLAFASDDLRLEAELVIPDEPRTVTILCHGIPSGRPHDPDDPGYAGLARAFADRGHAAAWFNFRGCRGAPGDFSIRGWRTDLEAAIDVVAARRECEGLPLIVAGSSAGGFVAITTAARTPTVRGVATLAAVASWNVADAPGGPSDLIAQFRNTGIIRDPAFPRDPAAWATEFAHSAAVDHVDAIAPRPLLIVHGDADDVVPYPHAERLFDLAGAPKELVRIPGGTHQLRRDPRAIAAILDWLDATDWDAVPRTSGLS